MSLQEIVAKRRDDLRHTRADLIELVQTACNKETPDYLLAAWLMAAYLNPMDIEQTAWLTEAMVDSGERMDLTGLPKPWVDKHSTGGVGDKTTLILLPLLAACGLTCIKMSGRGLGITGGTIDKLESIPGFRTDLSPTELKEQASRIGLALTGQTPNLAPADKVLYALRDVTGTVASLPLIVSSVLSKKIAGGAETIILDVKCGSGAFMHSEAQAIELAQWLKTVGEACNVAVKCVVTDMDETLGSCAGNALEVAEALEILSKSDSELSRPSGRLRHLCVELACITLVTSGASPDRAEATNRVEQALTSGAAWNKAQDWCKAQGGSLEEFRALPPANVIRQVHAMESGWISRFDAGIVGELVVNLGGGRHKKTDQLDHSVGIEIKSLVGTRVEKDDELCTIHAASEQAARAAELQIRTAVQISQFEIRPRPLFLLGNEC